MTFFCWSCDDAASEADCMDSTIGSWQMCEAVLPGTNRDDVSHLSLFDDNYNFHGKDIKQVGFSLLVHVLLLINWLIDLI